MLTISLLLLNFLRLQGEGLDCWEPGGWSGHKVTPDPHSRYPVNTHEQYWDISNAPEHQQPAVCESIRIKNWGIGWSIWFDHEVHKCSIYTYIESKEHSKHKIRGIECPVISPTQAPTFKPTDFPTKHPSKGPSGTPTKWPTFNPVHSPTKNPTQWPTKRLTKYPTVQPTKRPTKYPSLQPTNSPSHYPTLHPTETSKPTKGPTRYPTHQPINSPTKYPSPQLTEIPSHNPTHQPTESPKPTNPSWSLHPTKYPILEPTKSPIEHQTLQPSYNPTQYPAILPTVYPTASRQSTVKPPNKEMYALIAGFGALAIIICAFLRIYLSRRTRNRKKSNDFKRLQNLSNPLNSRVLTSQSTEKTDTTTPPSSQFLSPFTKRGVTISEKEYLNF